MSVQLARARAIATGHVMARLGGSPMAGGGSVECCNVGVGSASDGFELRSRAKAGEICVVA